MLVSLVTAMACTALAQPLAQRGDAVRYDGDKVVTVVVESEKVRRAVLGVSKGQWTCVEPGLGPVQVHVGPEGLAALDAMGLAYVIEIDNLQGVIDAENARLADAAREPGAPRGELPGTYFDDYRTSQQISDYMNALVEAYPDRISRQTIGASVEGREIYVMRITAPGKGPKPIILMNAVIHAREWITGSTGSYIVDRLVRNPDADPRIEALLNDYEVVLIPVLNPDGYAYTWSNDRLWRKNRRPPPIGSQCFGVDNNRNYGAFWGLNEGSDPSPCSETYRGTAAFSEPEDQAIRDFVLGVPTPPDGPGIVAYVDIHSYGRHVLSSYGHQAAPPEFVAELMDNNNNRLMAAISAVNGTRFRGGPTYGNLYAVSGGSHDWFLAERGVIGWTWELRDESSFVIPPSNILPAGREIFAGLLELGAILRENALHVRFSGPGRPVRTSSSTTTTVQFSMMRGVGLPDPAGTALWYRVGRVGPFTQAALSPADGGALAGQLPAAPCGAVVQYYVEGRTTQGASFTDPAGGAAGPYEAGVSDPDIFRSYDMETVGINWMNGGNWTNGEPNGTAAQPEYAQQATRCWMTGNSSQPGGGLSSNDVDSASAIRLTSPALELGGRTNVRVSYWRWFCANIGADPNVDTLTVEVSNNGTVWVPVETVGPGGPQARRGWFQRSFLLDSLLPPMQTTRIRFSTSDTGPDTFVEAAVDNLVVYRERCAAPCPGDWTRNGVVDESDVSELINAWFFDQENGTLQADFDGNGVSNSTDVSMFINAWLTPCAL